MRRVGSFTLPRDYNCKSVHSSLFRLHSCCLPGPAHVTGPSPHYRRYPHGHTTHYPAMIPPNGLKHLTSNSNPPRLKGQSNEWVSREVYRPRYRNRSLVYVYYKCVCAVAEARWTHRHCYRILDPQRGAAEVKVGCKWAAVGARATVSRLAARA